MNLVLLSNLLRNDLDLIKIIYTEFLLSLFAVNKFIVHHTI